MVEGAGLENQKGGNPFEGSNPSPSANFLLQTREGAPMAAKFLLVSKGFVQTDRTSETHRAPIFGL